MSIEIPEYIDEKFVINLFEVNLPSRNKEEIMSIDLLGKDLFFKDKFPGNLVCKLIAGRYYQSIDKLKESIFSYGRASHSAIKLYFLDTGLKCCQKTVNLGNIILNSSKTSSENNWLKKEIYYAGKRVEEIERRRLDEIKDKTYYLDKRTRKVLYNLFRKS